MSSEPESAWAALPDRYRPRIRHRSGYRVGAPSAVVVADTELLATPLLRPRRPPGGSDPVTRLRDMDSESIDQAVLYPTIGLYFSLLADPAAAVALAAASNEWLAGYCAADPRRLFGAAMLPLQDPPAAARELRRAVAELGLWPDSSAPTRLGRRCPTAPRRRVGGGRGARRAHRVHQGGSDVPTLGADRPFNPLIRHPGLRLLFLESSGGRGSLFNGWTSSAPSASGLTSVHCRPWWVGGPEPHRLGQRPAAPRRNAPRRPGGPPLHRGPLQHRHTGACARVNASASTACRRGATDCPGSSTTTSRRSRHRRSTSCGGSSQTTPCSRAGTSGCRASMPSAATT